MLKVNTITNKNKNKKKNGSSKVMNCFISKVEQSEMK